MSHLDMMPNCNRPLKTILVSIKKLEIPEQDYDPSLIEALADAIQEEGGFAQYPNAMHDGTKWVVTSGHHIAQAAKLVNQRDPRGFETMPIINVSGMGKSKQIDILERLQRAEAPRDLDLERMKQLKAEMLEIAARYGI